MQTALSFDDVLLIPRKSEILTRKDVEIGSSIGKYHFALPIMSSPMDTITEGIMALTMGNLGGLGIIHRYNSIQDQCSLVQAALTKLAGPTVSAAIGVSGDFEDRASALYDVGARIICVDVAHGHHLMVERTLKTLRDTFGDEIEIIAGNVATPEGFEDLQNWGASAIRVGIGGGSICSTRTQTGHGIPTLQSVSDCYLVQDTAMLIADGGIRNAGDVVKSMAAGANFVMLGSMLAGTDETPGNVFVDNSSKKYKVYRGMASREAQEDWRGTAASLEGISTTIPYKGPVEYILKDLAQNIRSGFSYSGAKNQRELIQFSNFVRQTPAGTLESSTHIMNRK